MVVGWSFLLVYTQECYSCFLFCFFGFCFLFFCLFVCFCFFFFDTTTPNFLRRHQIYFQSCCTSLNRTSNEGVFHFFHNLNIMCCPSLTFWITLVWKSILFDIRMATPAFFFRPFAWKIVFQPFTLMWCLSLSLRQNVLSFKSQILAILMFVR